MSETSHPHALYVTTTMDVNLAVALGDGKPNIAAAMLYNLLVYRLDDELVQEYQANNDGFFYMKSDYFCGKTGFDRRTYTRSIKSLEEAGLIECKRTYIKNTKVSTNHFKVIYPDWRQSPLYQNDNCECDKLSHSDGTQSRTLNGTQSPILYKKKESKEVAKEKYNNSEVEEIANRVKEYWNNMFKGVKSVPNVRDMTKDRVGYIRKLLEDGKTPEDFKEAIYNSRKSSFCRDSFTGFGFDWAFSDRRHFQKLLENTYNDKESKREPSAWDYAEAVQNEIDQENQSRGVSSSGVIYDEAAKLLEDSYQDNIGEGEIEYDY